MGKRENCELICEGSIVKRNLWLCKNSNVLSICVLTTEMFFHIKFVLLVVLHFCRIGNL
jgi:hypothetical protein